MPHWRGIYVSTLGILFMGTPHLGSEVASMFDLVASIMSVFKPTNNALLNQLKRDSPWLQQQQIDYATIGSEFHTIFFFEDMPTATFAGKSMIVRAFHKK
jgi:protein SERAC1